MKVREQTLTTADADFLFEVADASLDAGLYLKGSVRAQRAKRLVSMGMLEPGRLNPHRYVKLTEKGRQFVARRRGFE